MNIIETNKAPKALGPYSQAVEINGTYFFSGMLGINPETSEMQVDCESQLIQIMENIDGVLEASNLTRKNIVKTTIFLKDLNDFSKINNTYESYFEAPYPARSCVEVARLPKDAKVEIEVIALK